MTNTLSVAIIKRFMSETEFDALYEKYKANCSAKTVITRPVNDTDKQIFADFKEGLMVGKLAKKYGVSVAKIQSSILIAVKAQ